MRYEEFATKLNKLKLVGVRPDQVKRQRTINNLEMRIAAQNARHTPSSDDLAIAFANVSNLQRKANNEFKQRQARPK